MRLKWTPLRDEKYQNWEECEVGYVREANDGTWLAYLYDRTPEGGIGGTVRVGQCCRTLKLAKSVVKRRFDRRVRLERLRSLKWVD